jgi:hypothetical protein
MTHPTEQAGVAAISDAALLLRRAPRRVCRVLSLTPSTVAGPVRLNLARLREMNMRVSRCPRSRDPERPAGIWLQRQLPGPLAMVCSRTMGHARRELKSRRLKTAGLSRTVGPNAPRGMPLSPEHTTRLTIKCAGEIGPRGPGDTGHFSSNADGAAWHSNRRTTAGEVCDLSEPAGVRNPQVGERPAAIHSSFAYCAAPCTGNPTCTAGRQARVTLKHSTTSSPIFTDPYSTPRPGRMAGVPCLEVS